MARPTKFSDVTSKAILDAIGSGCTEEDAAGAAGINQCTLVEWKRRYPDFAKAVDGQKYQAKVKAVGSIAKAINQGSWKAALAWLERRYPREWGKTDRLDVVIKRDAKELAAEFGLPLDEVEAEYKRILAERS